MAHAATRPPFEHALAFWQALLAERGLAGNIRWVFRENLCLEQMSAGDDDQPISFETTICPVREGDVQMIYDIAARVGDLVFSTLVHTPDFTLCTLLGDTWLADDDVYCEDWGMYFFASDPYTLWAQIDDPNEWRQRKLHEHKKLSGLDFVFALDKIKRLQQQDAL